MFSRLNEKGKYKGSGTGLALCKKIMEMHGGFITVEGIPDKVLLFIAIFRRDQIFLHSFNINKAPSEPYILV